MSRLGEQLIALRRARGWSREELRQRARIAEQTVYDIEHGVTRSPNGNTLRKLAKAFDIEVDQLLISESRIYTPNPLSLGDERRPHLDWNAPETRLQILSRVSPALASDSGEITRFIDYLDILNNYRWLDDPAHVQTTAMEFSDIWADPAFFVPYEATLLRFDKAGRQVDRLFLIDSSKLKHPSYLSAVIQVLGRHIALGLRPKILRLDEANSMHREIGVVCDAFMVLDAKWSLIVNYPSGSEPAYIRSDNLKFAANASNVFLHYWRGCRDADVLLQRFPPSERERNLAARDAEQVFCAYDLSRSL